MDETPKPVVGNEATEDDWPKLDRSAFSVGFLGDESDEKEYWLSKTPQERLQAVEMMRRMNYGYARATARIQRVLEIAELGGEPMNRRGRHVTVTLALPAEVYERAEQAAIDEQRRLEDLLGELVAEGLDAHMSVRELLEQVSTQYRTRLAQEGKLEQSPDEVLQDLRDLREQVARELYP